MALLLHIIIALSSLLFTGYLYLRPSHAKLYASYGFIALTFASGTFLVMTRPAHMLEACLMGIVYFGVTVLGALFAKRKLAHAPIKSE